MEHIHDLNHSHEYELGSSLDDYDHASDDSGVNIAKGSAMIVLFSVSLFMGLIPMKLSKWFKWNEETDIKSNLLVSLLLAFGGGVLLSTTFLHLLPEVNENIENLTASGILPEYPFSMAELLMCAGFFIIFLVEELVHLYLHRRERRYNTEMENVFRRTLSIRRGEKDQIDIAATISTADLLESQRTSTCNNLHIIATNPNNDLGSIQSIDHHNHTSGHSHMVLPTGTEEDPFVTSLRGLLIVLALSVHELFEGLAVGLEKSTANVWFMFGAVAAHKFVIAFCIGVELIANKTKVHLIVLYVFCFAVVSPSGIGMGIALNESQLSQEGIDMASVFLQGLATGTLLYVVFFEVLSNRDRQGLKHYAVILLGFLLMFGFEFISGEHSHGHDSTGATAEHGHHHH